MLQLERFRLVSGIGRSNGWEVKVAAPGASDYLRVQFLGLHETAYSSREVPGIVGGSDRLQDDSGCYRKNVRGFTGPVAHRILRCSGSRNHHDRLFRLVT